MTELLQDNLNDLLHENECCNNTQLRGVVIIDETKI